MNIKNGKETSVVRLHEELKAVVVKDGYSAHPQINIASLTRQGSTAGISIPEIGVIPLSLGTFKSSCRVIQGGFETFDSTRVAALGVMTTYEMRVSGNRSTTHRSQAIKLANLEREASDLKDELMKSSRVISRLMELLRTYANISKHPQLEARISGDINEIERRLAYDTNVVSIRRGDK